MLIFWLLLFGLVTESFGANYGIPTLFFFPEYLGETGLLAHFMLGFACGGFIMAFHIASYIANGYKFPFIATLASPFLKYSYNNSLIPLVFLAFYLKAMYTFQIERELLPQAEVVFHLLSFVGGTLIFFLFGFSYFLGTNRSVGKIKKGKELKDQRDESVKNLLHKEQNWIESVKRTNSWQIKTYIGKGFRIKLARHQIPYSMATLRKIMQQNHINASFFEVALIVTVILFGVFGDNPVFFIPAGASIFLVLTLILMVYSAFRSWLKSWAPITLVALLVGINYLSSQELFSYINHAYGLTYSEAKQPYNEARFIEMQEDMDRYEEDLYFREVTLGKWKEKNTFQGKKPYLVLVNCSGGGMRSAAWTYTMLSHLDSLSKGKFFESVHLISGSSGGVLGASFFRELKRIQKERDITIQYKKGFAQISSDILNPIAYKFAVQDMFYRPRNLEINGQTYIRDRAYAFERQLNENTGFLLDNKLSFYRTYEEEATLPTVVLAPTITNDGRRLLISASDISFLTHNNVENDDLFHSIPESIEFRRFFAEQNADDMLFTSGLRMSATFPYVLPNVSLPTNPTIEVMDAGVRDNFGLLNNLNFAFHLRDWIERNTSGVIIVQIRDTPKKSKINQNPILGLFKALFNPLGGFTRNWINIQQYNQDQMVQYLKVALDKPLEVIDLQLDQKAKEEIPISWHLTNKERLTIQKAVHQNQNEANIEYLLSKINAISQSSPSQ